MKEEFLWALAGRILWPPFQKHLSVEGAIL